MPYLLVRLVVFLFSAFFCLTSVQASDFYLKAVTGIERSGESNFRDQNCASSNPAALFGCGPGENGKPLGAYGDFGVLPVLEAAVGKQVFPWLRSEVTFSYRPNISYSGQANFLKVPGDQPVSALADSFSFLVNFYLELAGVVDWKMGPFRPYLGGGLGIAHNRLGRVTYHFPGLSRHKFTFTPSGESTGPVFTASLGTGIILSEKLMLDMAFRYTDLGTIGTGAGKAEMNHLPAGIMIGETWAPLRTYGIFVGLRYLFP